MGYDELPKTRRADLNREGAPRRVGGSEMAETVSL